MPVVKFVTHNGDVREVDATSGTSLMQVAVDNGIDEIVAECGGACSCATCHCYIDEAWTDKVGGPASQAELDMLENTAADVKPNSRLTRQIAVTPELDGLIVHMPEAQY